MDFQQLLDNITPDIYQSLKRAVELGKWPDGNKLTSEQKQLSLQAVIAYECKNLPPEERSGYVPPKPDGCDTDLSLDQEAELKWKQ